MSDGKVSISQTSALLSLLSGENRHTSDRPSSTTSPVLAALASVEVGTAAPTTASVYVVASVTVTVYPDSLLTVLAPA